MVRKKTKRVNARRGAQTAVQSKVLSALHQVWLAGLGAAARAQRGAPKLFDELVAEGARFQSDKRGLAEQTVRRIVGGAHARLKDTLGEAQGRATETLENLEKIFQARVQRSLTQLGIPSAAELAALSERVDVLNGHIEKLAKRRTTPGRVGTSRAESKAAAPIAP